MSDDEEQGIFLFSSKSSFITKVDISEEGKGEKSRPCDIEGVENEEDGNPTLINEDDLKSVIVDYDEIMSFARENEKRCKERWENSFSRIEQSQEKQLQECISFYSRQKVGYSPQSLMNSDDRAYKRNVRRNFPVPKWTIPSELKEIFPNTKKFKRKRTRRQRKRAIKE